MPTADPREHQGIRTRRHAAQRPRTEAPEHRGERRRFLIWALMLGATKPEIVTERVLDELEAEGEA